MTVDSGNAELMTNHKGILWSSGTSGFCSKVTPPYKQQHFRTERNSRDHVI